MEQTMSLLIKPPIADITEKPEFSPPITGTHVTAGGVEEVMVETALADPFWFDMYVFLNNLVAGDDFTIRVYVRDNAGAYQLKDQQQFAGAQAIKVYEINRLYGDGDCDIRVTIQRNSGVDRAFPFRWDVLKEV